MAINVQFQNIGQANAEILKAFNSANSAKALEAYQPLDSKQRKLEKLRALQILKQSSAADTLADISLSTSTLSVALQNAEGATLQAMLNLLSAKMIEQNKYTYFAEDKKVDVRKKVKEKLEERKEEKLKSVKEKKEEKEQEKKDDQEEKQESAIDKLVNAAVTYYKEMEEWFVEKYKNIVSAMSLENIKKAFNDGLKMVVRYAYEVPAESFKEFFIDPIEEFRSNLRDYIDNSLQNGFTRKTTKAFTPTEIKSILQQSFSPEQKINNNAKLKKSVDILNKSLILKKKLKVKKSRMASGDMKLALHR